MLEKKDGEVEERFQHTTQNVYNLNQKLWNFYFYLMFSDQGILKPLNIQRQIKENNFEIESMHQRQSWKYRTLMARCGQGKSERKQPYNITIVPRYLANPKLYVCEKQHEMLTTVAYHEEKEQINFIKQFILEYLLQKQKGSVTGKIIP